MKESSVYNQLCSQGDIPGNIRAETKPMESLARLCSMEGTETTAQQTTSFLGSTPILRAPDTDQRSRFNENRNPALTIVSLSSRKAVLGLHESYNSRGKNCVSIGNNTIAKSVHTDKDWTKQRLNNDKMHQSNCRNWRASKR